MDSYRPQHRSRFPSPPPQRTDLFQFGQNRRHGFRFKPKAFERDLLTQQPTTVEKPILPSTQADPKYRDVEDMTDSDEAEMEEDSDFEDAQPIKKRKLAGGPQTPTEQPMWSNPDPYTSLPPAPEASGKRRDVVKLIRKARNEFEKQDNFAADQDDFISFGHFDDVDFLPPIDAPTGPKADRYGTTGKHGVLVIDSASVQALGKRKREDSESESLLGRYGRHYHANGAVLTEWRELSGQSRSPWLRPFTSTDSAIVALHKEIIDFHLWVKPQEHETLMRQDLVNRLEQELSRLRPGELKAFGSYAAGLYLPTGDMDLVYFTHARPKHFGLSSGDFHEFVRFLRRSKIPRSGSIVPIAKAKVPIIKFIDALTGLRVDLSFHNTTGINAINTFEKWQAAHPAMPIIVSVVKQFLMIRGLNDNSVGGLGGFSTICMVTSLLQHMPNPQNPNLGEILIEFFNLYGNLLDFKNVGIRLDPPGYVRKSSYSSLKKVEKEDRLMIIDPNQPDNNISGGSKQAGRILKLYSKTHETLCQKLEQFSEQKTTVAEFSFLDAFLGGNFTAYDQQRASLRTAYQQTMTPSSRLPSPPPPPPSRPPPAKVAPPPPPPPRRPKPVKTTPQPVVVVAAAVQATSTPAAVQTTSASSPNDSKQDDNPPPPPSVKRLMRLRELRPDLETALKSLKTISKNQAVEIAGYENVEDMTVKLAALDTAQMLKRREERKISRKEARKNKA